jgi:hypothetical protein
LWIFPLVDPVDPQGYNYESFLLSVFQRQRLAKKLIILSSIQAFSTPLSLMSCHQNVDAHSPQPQAARLSVDFTLPHEAQSLTLPELRPHLQLRRAVQAPQTALYLPMEEQYISECLGSLSDDPDQSDGEEWYDVDQTDDEEELVKDHLTPPS